MAPKAVRCEKRDVRQIANAVARVAENRLPGRLGVSGARSANYSGKSPGSRGAPAGPAAAANGIEQVIRVVAVTRRAVGRAESVIVSQDLACAGIVPRDLRNVGFGGIIVSAIGCIPESVGDAGSIVAEVRAADGDIVWRGGEAADADSAYRHLCSPIGQRGGSVAGGDEHRHARRGGGLI